MKYAALPKNMTDDIFLAQILGHNSGVESRTIPTRVGRTWIPDVVLQLNRIARRLESDFAFKS